MLCGFIASYTHQGRIGVLVEIQAVSLIIFEMPEVQKFVEDLRLHIASRSPTDVGELLEQPFVTDETATVGETLAELREFIKAPLEIARFVRWDTDPPKHRVGDDGPEPAPPYAAQLKVVS